VPETHEAPTEIEQVTDCGIGKLTSLDLRNLLSTLKPLPLRPDPQLATDNVAGR
jgi:hypothetical protein